MGGNDPSGFFWMTNLHRVMRRMVLKRRARGTTLIPPPGDLQDKFRDAKQVQRLDWGEELLQSQRRLRDNPMKISDTITFESRGCKKSCKQMAMQLYCIGLCWWCERAKKNDGGEEAGSLQNFKFKGFQQEGKCEAPIYGCSENSHARTDPY